MRCRDKTLHRRACHIFAEAQRVVRFREICEKPEYPAQMADLGKLMDESHYSCRDLYQCSSTELEELTKMCRAAGAFGARLTGAGWGGCVVALIDCEKVNNFLLDVEAVCDFCLSARIVLHEGQKHQAVAHGRSDAVPVRHQTGERRCDL
ncbi:MAG: hypothetical protein P4M11_10105 [Candidatus Pacebacteria bacterium]|nr:hypothetical protein [Candidatus Paceibacterota bacterium]